MWTGKEDSQCAVEDMWPARPESCTLTFVVKLLQLSEEYTDQDVFKLSLLCGTSCVAARGTLNELNEEMLGNAVRLQGDDCMEKFLQFLNENNIEVVLHKQSSLFCSAVMKLRDTKVAQLDSIRDQGDPMEVAFALHGPNNAAPVGTVRMILETSFNKVSSPATENSGRDSAGETSLIYIINDAEHGSPSGKDAITCDKCSGLRSPDDGGFQYELIDGILHEKTISSTEQEIRRIRQKVRTLTVDELIEHRDSFSPDGPDGPNGRCCNRCGGLTITGTTCETVEADGVKRASGFGDFRQNTVTNAQLCKPNVNKVQHGISRYCDRCNACLSWLPDYCRCPKCGYKKHQGKRVPVEGLSQAPCSREPANLPDDRDSSSSLSGSTLVASSHSCPICHLRQGRCTDCAEQTRPMRSASSDSEMHHHSHCMRKRPQTRYRNRTRARTAHPIDSRSCKNERLEQLRKAYLDPAGQTKSSASKLLTQDSEETGAKRPTAKQIRHSYRAFLRKVRQQNRNRYSYRFGKRPPGMVAGHKTCMEQEELVPPYMGWRWNICTPGIGKVRPGWRPGAVRKPIMQLMQHFLKCYPLDIVPVSSRKLCGPCHPANSGDQCPMDTQKPMLQITKKHGEYSITMNPLKDSETLKTAKDPFLPCTPIKFKLSKDPHLTKLYKLRESLKQKSMTLCGCKDLDSCEHQTKREKQLLAAEIRRVAKVLGLSPETTIADVPSGSESENDLEFTPQSAIVRGDFPKPDVVIAGTQYYEQDYSVIAGKYPYGRKLTKVPIVANRTLAKCPATPATKTTPLPPGTSKGATGRATPVEGSSKAKPGTQAKSQPKGKGDVLAAKASAAGKAASGVNQPTSRGATTQRKSTVPSGKSSGKSNATPVPKVTTQTGKSTKK
ncbi:uncharacterized protein LOC118457543 isoform X2 [Anopheles albimanus]|uniref:uncharacterized protein LOC118457543 isoform X2 n=1 Tax=Anopheles albimanus TaxID=7167 RepID=UPI001641AA69|nr:uncharacterized protein LOC118457543 isoform X2 [Anopheles albimanus]